MTIEPPSASIGHTLHVKERNQATMNSESAVSSLSDPGEGKSSNGQMNTTNPYVHLPNESPDQYLACDQGVMGTSPNSMLMYESDVGDMQKALLSPVNSQSSAPFSETFGGCIVESPHTKSSDILEESRLNMEDMELCFENSHKGSSSHNIKTEHPWSPQISVDTGQSHGDYEYENVMMNNQSSHTGPTLAELNNTSVIDEISVLDDINTIISNDLKGQPSLSTLKIEPSSPTLPVSSTASAPVGIPVVGRGHSASHSRTQDIIMTISQDVGKQNASLFMTNNMGLAQSCPLPQSHQMPMVTERTRVQVQPSSTITSPLHQAPVTVIKQEMTPTVSPQMVAVPMPIFHAGTNLILVENNTPKTKPPVDWSYPGELSTVDRPSLLKLLAPEPNVQPPTVDIKSMTRRPIHVPKRTRGLSEGSGLMQLQEERELKGLKRSGSPDSDQSNSSTSSFGKKWEEIKKYLDGTPGVSRTTNVPPKKIKVESQMSEPVPEVSEPSMDYGSDSDSDLEFSDTESVGSHSSFVEELLVGGKKEKRFFWQYNTQAKGPKGKRLCKNLEPHDPHVLSAFEDPVFDPDMNDASYRHTGRARKGDGNDVTPSPWKLFQIGNQLKRLNRKIHDIAPPGELPATVRNDSRREKNKYASRACRLKKKAQHEANKIKLYGLDTEHTELMTVLVNIKRQILHRATSSADKQTVSRETHSEALDRLIKQHLSAMIAGNTADYVNSVLEKVAQGDKTGGLDLRRH